MTNTFYTMSHDGEVFDLEFTSKQKLLEWAEEWLAERVTAAPEEPIRNGDTFIEDIVVVTYEQEDGSTDMDRIVSCEPEQIEYTHYHGDYEEHNTLWGL